MNEKSKERLKKLNKQLITKLEEAFSVNVYQDSVGENEEKDYHFFIFETLGFEKTETKFSLKQTVLVRYYSENRDDLDEVMLDIISLLEGVSYVFDKSDKTTIPKGETDSCIDELIFYFTRTVKHGC